MKMSRCSDQQIGQAAAVAAAARRREAIVEIRRVSPSVSLSVSQSDPLHCPPLSLSLLFSWCGAEVSEHRFARSGTYAEGLEREWAHKNARTVLKSASGARRPWSLCIQPVLRARPASARVDLPCTTRFLCNHRATRRHVQWHLPQSLRAPHPGFSDGASTRDDRPAWYNTGCGWPALQRRRYLEA